MILSHVFAPPPLTSFTLFSLFSMLSSFAVFIRSTPNSRRLFLLLLLLLCRLCRQLHVSAQSFCESHHAALPLVGWGKGAVTEGNSPQPSLLWGARRYDLLLLLLLLSLIQPRPLQHTVHRCLSSVSLLVFIIMDGE